MGALLALASALLYGVADFAGGLLSRRAHFVSIALTGQVSGFVLTLAAAPLVPATDLALPDLAWGALSGVGTGMGMMFLYRGLSHASMTVVVPVSAVGGLALPVLVGVALLGDRPSVLAWLGIVVAVPALWLVAQARERGEQIAATATLDGLVAGLGIALQYLALAQAGTGAGIWPVVAGRVTAGLTILLLAGRGASRGRLRVPWRLAVPAAATGGVAAFALVCYLLATRQQLMAVVVVLASLYPAIPVLLGITALRERLTGWQVGGLVASGAAIALLSSG
jgi:drug/metabolite transporter (DMT)-like permease